MIISREVKVGLFVLLSLIVSGVVVFLLGDQRHLFERSVDFVTSFDDVQGLNVGATVRMHGINVGSVTDVSHSENLGDPRIHVSLWVVRSEALRIHDDARAFIVNKGLLGDKMLEIDPGTPNRPVLAEHSIIPGENPTDFSNLTHQVGSIAERTNSVLANLDRVSKDLANDELQQDLRGSARSINIILKHVAEGNGYANRLLTDPSEADRVSRTLANFDRTSAELSATAQEIHQLARQVNQGPGFAHSLFYSEQGSKSIGQFGDAAEEVALSLRGIRQGNGMAKGLLYGGTEGEQQQMIENLTQSTRDLRDIMAGLKAGKGTLGALLVDPSVYEDLKLVLGNVQRNEVLRALVRYSIKQDESRPQVEVQSSSPTPAPSR